MENSMFTYIVLALVAGILLFGFSKLASFLAVKENLTTGTPVTLSLVEIENAGLKDVIDQFTAGTTPAGEGLVQLSIPDFLNVLLQKCSQHEREIGELAKAVDSLSIKKSATKKNPSKKKK